MGQQAGKEAAVPSSSTDAYAGAPASDTSPSLLTPEAFFQKMISLPAVVSEKAVKATGTSGGRERTDGSRGECGSYLED